MFEGIEVAVVERAVYQVGSTSGVMCRLMDLLVELRVTGDMENEKRFMKKLSDLIAWTKVRMED